MIRVIVIVLAMTTLLGCGLRKIEVDPATLPQVAIQDEQGQKPAGILLVGNSFDVEKNYSIHFKMHTKTVLRLRVYSVVTGYVSSQLGKLFSPFNAMLQRDFDDGKSVELAERDVLVINRLTTSRRTMNCETNFLGYILECSFSSTEVLSYRYKSADGRIEFEGSATGKAEKTYDGPYEDDEVIELIVESYHSALEAIVREIQRKRREIVASI